MAIYAMLGDAQQQTLAYLLVPVLLGCAYLLLVQWVVAAGVRLVTPSAAADGAAASPWSALKEQLGSLLARIDALHAPHAATPLSGFCGAFLSLGGLSFGEALLRSSGVAPQNTLLFVGSFGALSTLLFAAPAAPLGKPRNTFYGHTISVLIALAVHLVARPLLEMAHVPLPLVLERALTPALAIGAMAYFKIPHPPAAACVAVYATLGDVGQQTPAYLLTPALLGCLYAVAVQWAVALCLRRCGASMDALSCGGVPTKASESVQGLMGKVDVWHAPHGVSGVSAFCGAFLGLGGLSVGLVS